MARQREWLPPAGRPWRRWLVVCVVAAALSTVVAQVSENALVIGQPGQLVPGMIIGQGRYVLAEKLCDLQDDADEKVFLGPNINILPQPSERLLLPAGGRQSGGAEVEGGLVPHEGLVGAITHDLPQLSLWNDKPSQLNLKFLPAVFDYSVSFVRSDPNFQETWGYRFGQRLGKGSFGEAWRAVALDGSMREVVLKRLFVERGAHVQRSGEREIHFGTMLQNRPQIARFIESFEDTHHRKTPELWLVFHNEGFSLTHHLFQMQPGSPLLKLSDFWWQVKQRQPLGGQLIKNIVYQVLLATAVAHELNITHRDVKLANVFMTDTWPPVVRLGDWGSALVRPPNSEMLKLYAPDGPTEDEETDNYRPPEAMFDQEILARTGVSKEGSWRSTAYDIFSIGVLLLELILGTPGVFNIDDRRWLRLEHKLKQMHIPPARLEQGRQLQGLVDFCLGPPGGPPEVPLSWFLAPDASGQLPAGYDYSSVKGDACSDIDFARVLQERDPAHVGLESAEGRDLLRRLLKWAPEERISARDALAHPWFDDSARLPPIRRSQSQAARASEEAEAEDREEQEEEPQETEEPEDSKASVDGSVGALSPGVMPHYERGVGDVDERGEADFVEGVSCGDEETATRGHALASGCPLFQLHVAAHSDIGRRREMEDRYVFGNFSGVAGRQCGAAKYRANQAHGAFVGVYDGHSGDAVADQLRRHLHRHVESEPSFPGSIPDALRSAFAAFDRRLLRLDRAALVEDAEGAARPKEPGSTALLLVVAGCEVYTANLGDCRAVAARPWRQQAADEGGVGGDSHAELHMEAGLWPLGARVEVRKARGGDLEGQRGTIVEVRSASRRLYMVRLLRDGALRPFRQSVLRLLSELEAVRLTEDHKPGSERERRRIEALGGDVEVAVSGGIKSIARVADLATSRSFGSWSARPFVSTEPDIVRHVFEIGGDSFIILASDGVWDVLEDQLAVDLVWDQISSVHDSRLGPAAALKSAAQLIVQRALEQGSMDNVSCAIVLFMWSACSSGAGKDGACGATTAVVHSDGRG